MNKIAIIMAGGKGQRFWPASREDKPKQLLSIISNKSMIRQTYLRVQNIFKNEHIFIVTGEKYKSQISKELPEIPLNNIICEPEGRDTSNAIALASIYIRKKFDDGLISVLSADHFINPIKEFEKTLNNGFNFAFDRDILLTIGITPTRPETGYGYIEKGDIQNNDETPVFKVKNFREKPNENTAIEYLHSGNYLWNSGMFIWKNSTFLNEFSKYLPDNYSIIKNIEKSISNKEEQETISSLFPKLKKISVDYGILEKSNIISCIEASFAWDDLGSWSSIYRHSEQDKNGNVIKANVKLLNSKNCLLISDDSSLINIINQDGIMVIKNGDVILVCSKEDDQKVKELLSEIKKDEKNKKHL